MVDAKRNALALINAGSSLLTDPAQAIWLCPLLIAVEAIFCALIIQNVAFTEIDWKTYMAQIKLFVAGVRDYALIKGPTGQLVYPALHVYIYRALYWLTDEGENVKLAQAVFSLVYLVTLGLVMGCYRLAKAPPYIYPLLVLSKRLHSIFLLRNFNDGFAVLFLFAATLLLQKRLWTPACIVYSLGLAVKMSLLLVAPAFAPILYMALGGGGLFRQGATVLNIQAILSMPFLRANYRAYFTRAFDLGRQFEYKWTVNWRFVAEPTFLSLRFALALLAVHVALLVFFLYTRWLAPIKQSLGRRTYPDLFDVTEAEQAAVIARLTPQWILTAVLSANVIGMLCARSLHYQFYAWLGWATPFLLWRAKLHPALIYFLWIGQEVAWNVYPSSDLSSKIVVGVLAVTVVQVWVGTEGERGEQVSTGMRVDEGVSGRADAGLTDDERLLRSLREEE